MPQVSIIGTGTMAQAISGVLAAGGAEVELIGHGSTDSPTGDVVVLAVPHPALDDVLTTHGAALAGKIVVDITNPVDFATFDSLVVPPDSSMAARIAAALPGSRVLKAFNTTFGATLATGRLGGVPTTVLVAGDDEDAKATLVSLVEAGGLRAIDAGPLSRARELESVGFLQITLAAREKLGWDGGFAVV
jgi:NADPH-dependent F420 reductase